MSMLKTLMSLAVIAMIFELAMAANYTVGAPNGGWDSSTDLATWASSQSFSVGDNLLFTYAASHDVVEVPKADYDSCQLNSPIQTYNGGSTVITLASSGKRYFICGTPGHCSGGMKVEIDTLAASAPPPSTPATPPPSTPATPPAATPATPPAATPTPPPAAAPATPPPASAPKSAPTMSPPSKSPVNSPKSAPTMSPPSKSPTIPSTESPTSSLPPSGSLPPPPPSSASKINIWVGFTAGLGFVISMLLNL